MQVTDVKDKVCYCAIGAGGKPCVDRAHCDKHGNDYFYIKYAASFGHTNKNKGE